MRLGVAASADWANVEREASAMRAAQSNVFIGARLGGAGVAKYSLVSRATQPLPPARGSWRALSPELHAHQHALDGIELSLNGRYAGKLEWSRLSFARSG